MLRERKELEEYYSELLGDDFDRTFDGFVCRDNTGKLITPYYASNHFKNCNQESQYETQWSLRCTCTGVVRLCNIQYNNELLQLSGI